MDENEDRDPVAELDRGCELIRSDCFYKRGSSKSIASFLSLAALASAPMHVPEQEKRGSEKTRKRRAKRKKEGKK